MSFVRSSKVTYKVAVPVLLAGLLATGIVFIEAPAANAAACSTTATGYAGGAGTSGDPFQVSTAAQLIRLSTTSADWSSKHFVQTADIDLGDCEWTAIGTSATKFTGSYNGSGFAVRGLYINRTNGAGIDGLFGSISAATIQNLIVEGQITSNASYVGGLVGDVNSTSSISKVLVLVDITYPGGDYVGGIVGNFEAGTVRYSAYRGSMSASNEYGSIGSFTGYTLEGTTVDSYGRAAMSGLSEYKSGMNGANNVKVTRGYTVTPGANWGIARAQNAGPVSNSFWDSQAGPASAQFSGSISGATGKTTAQLKDFSTFTAASWDIVDGWEAFSTTGTPKIWGICSQVNNGYPFLLWEYSDNPCGDPASAPSITSIAPASSSGSLSVAFTAPTSNGGLQITNYKYSTDNGATWVTRSPGATTSPLVIQGLTNGTSYQIKLLAINSVGDGAASTAVSGTPAAPTAASDSTSAAPAATSLATTGTSSSNYLALVPLFLAVGALLVWLGRGRRSEGEPK